MTRPVAAPPERQTLTQQVYVELREWLISGTLSPGDKLSLRRVAEQMGVSMMPVREAVSRLIADAALEVLPNRAVRVPVLSLERFRELTTIRLALEGFAVERAASVRSAVDLRRIRLNDAAFRRQCGRKKPDTSAAVRANRAFHFSVYAAAGLPALIPMIEGLWLRIGPVLNLDMRASPERLQIGLAEQCHAQLVKAIAAQDPEAARDALVADIRGAAAFIESRSVLVDTHNPDRQQGD